MSTPTTDELPPPPEGFLNNRQLTELLIRHFNYTEGHYALSLGFNVALGNFATTTAEPNPGILGIVTQIGISRADAPNPATVDASTVTR